MRVKCLRKNRDTRGNIVNYHLMDETGHQFFATGQQIKEEMKSGRFEFLNLQIDKAGRLVDKAEVKEPIQKNTVCERKQTPSEEEKRYTLKELRLTKERLLAKSRYHNLDWKNEWFAEHGYTWDKKVVLAEKFIVDKERLKIKLKNDILAEIVTCRAAWKYMLPSEYIMSLSPEEKQKETELAEEFKVQARRCEMDPVDMVYAIMNEWEPTFNTDWFNNMYVQEDLWIKNPETDEPMFMAGSCDCPSSSYIQLKEKLFLVFLD